MRNEAMVVSYVLLAMGWLNGQPFCKRDKKVGKYSKWITSSGVLCLKWEEIQIISFNLKKTIKRRLYFSIPVDAAAINSRRGQVIICFRKRFMR
jgi:hypothetical protein